MSSYTNLLQRRKSSKTKSKQAETTATADNGSAAFAAASQIDRLQRNTLSDKLDALRKQKQQQQHQQHLNNVTRSTTSTLCNGVGIGIGVGGGSITCCRDINCRLNATFAAAVLRHERLTISGCGTGGGVIGGDYRASQSQRSSSCFSQRSTNSPSPHSSESGSYSTHADTPLPKSAATAPAQLRDGSPDSGVSSDGDVLHDRALFEGRFTINLKLDAFSWLLFALAFCTRFYKLASPSNVVFDELHYGKYISFYLRNVFFFDQHPPLGKQIIATVAHFAGYDGNFTFPRIGTDYSANVPIFWLRFVPALCGSLLSPAVYKLLLEARLNRWTSLLGGLLIVFDNALLTQSRFILMESMLLLSCALGLYCMLKFQRSRFGGPIWLICGIAAATFFTFAASVKHAGFLSVCLAAYLSCRYLWDLLYDATRSDFQIIAQTLGRLLLFTAIPISLYVGIFYVHLHTLYRAGPHDSVMTSAFQASLEGGLASITKGQPLKVVHGSQITLRHTHGRTCWLHSHAHVYPVRYPDKRGSSYQQQVTCYSFKDVNNWWIVKRPDREDLVVGDELDAIRHGDVIQLVHGITSRGLNSHDVAAPMTPQCQEVSCYIDYEIKMSGELLWRVEILNKDTEGSVWHAIKSEIRLIHETTGAALRFTGRQLPDWGFNQHEVVADRIVEHKDAIWNVEEHRYTKTQDQREREQQLLNAEMIPTKKTKLTFWQKFIELQTKMLWHSKTLASHMYSSEPLEWPLLDKSIAYWVDNTSNAQIHLLGNVLLWYTGTIALLIYAALSIFYVLRRCRLCYDLPPSEWQRFLDAGDIFFVGYLIHYLPYFFVDHTLFLHHYLPAFLFKMLLLCFIIEHVDYLLRHFCANKALWVVRSYRLGVLIWISAVAIVFVKFLPLSYGVRKMSADDVIALRWKDTWDFILQRDYNLNQE